MNLDSKEIARYLGSRGADLWPEAAALAADCQRELEGTVTPRTLGRRLSLSLFAGQSRDLDHHLRHCTEGILFAVTLGAETDRLLRRWSAQSMAKAAQRQVLDLLQAPKRIGLTLTAGGMLVPEKSITALVGLSDRQEESCGQKCMRCQKKNCAFRCAPAEAN